MVKYDQAIKLIDSYNFKRKIITVDSLHSNDMILANDYYAKVAVPSFRKSAMDGFALNSSDDLSSTFQIVDTIYAGDSRNPKLTTKQCVKIMTGAPVPDGLDIVLVKELATETDGFVSFSVPKTKLNPNICQIGEDIANQSLVFKAGTLITPTIIASMVSCGIFQIEVYAKPQILLITTGDEVITSNHDLAHGQIYNSNMAYLYTSLTAIGCMLKHIHINDQTTSLTQTLDTSFDLIITTGAISVGDKDIIRNYILETKPSVIFDRVNIMPGGPVVFWQHRDTPVISLAGSPFANFVTYQLLARRIIANLANNQHLIAPETTATLTSAYDKQLKKLRFVKAHISGQEVSIPANNHKASSLYEMSMCNCLIKLERGVHDLKPGDTVTIIDLRRKYD